MVDAPDAGSPDTPETPTKKSRLRTLLPFGIVVVGEAALIIGALMLFSGPPEVKGSDSLDPVMVPDDAKVVEQLVVDGRFANTKRGVTYIYQTEIYVQVKRRHQEQVAAELEQFRNEIKAQLNTVWRTSDPKHFDEPRLENLTRKVYALMSDRFGFDQESGDPIVTKVIIVMGTGMRVEG
jgi:hypothetical protein